MEKSKNSAEGIDQAIWIHPRIQAGIDKKYRRLSPWWDRKLTPVERGERWDNFLADIHSVENWDHVDPNREPLRSIEDVMCPAEFAEAQLHKLHDMDLQVKREIRINRKAPKENSSGESWGGKKSKVKNNYNPDQFVEQEDCL